MRRLKKNGGKRKRAPPKPKDPALQASSQPTGTLPVLTSPSCPQNGQQLPTENNNFMFSPNSSDGLVLVIFSSSINFSLKIRVNAKKRKF